MEYLVTLIAVLLICIVLKLRYKIQLFKSVKEGLLVTVSLFVIRSIVEKHGGTVEIDLATDTIHIDVPEKEQIACAQEIEEQVGALC